MRILVTNDDGIHAPGLQALERIAQQLADDVVVVAPEHDQSGASHALSLNDPLRLRKISDRRFGVKGTPSDCVIMGVREILKARKPDLILSGVNRGSNIADDVTYSGTIAAAIEGTILGVPSVALSQSYHADDNDNINWDCAEVHAPRIIKALLDEGIDRDVLINLNFPACPPEDVADVVVTIQGRRDVHVARLERRFDGRGNPYYWVAFDRDITARSPGTDIDALWNNRISVTPLKLNMTDEVQVTRYTRVFESLGRRQRQKERAE